MQIEAGVKTFLIFLISSFILKFIKSILNTQRISNENIFRKFYLTIIKVLNEYVFLINNRKSNYSTLRQSISALGLICVANISILMSINQQYEEIWYVILILLIGHCFSVGYFFDGRKTINMDYFFVGMMKYTILVMLSLVASIFFKTDNYLVDSTFNMGFLIFNTILIFKIHKNQIFFNENKIDKHIHEIWLIGVIYLLSGFYLKDLILINYMSLNYQIIFLITILLLSYKERFDIKNNERKEILELKREGIPLVFAMLVLRIVVWKAF